MNKYILHIWTVALVSVAVFTSCKDNEPEQEMFNFPIELFPVEISNISDVRFFIGGEEVFDAELCESFISSEWWGMNNESQRYNFFDEDNFMDDHILKNITFVAQDTAIIGNLRFIIEQNNSLFVFHPYNNQYSTNNSSNYFRENFNLEQTANGKYTDLIYDIVNIRYSRDVNDTPLWEDNSLGFRIFGIACRIDGKIDYDYIDISMHPKDTLAFQQYQVKYQILKQD